MRMRSPTHADWVPESRLGHAVSLLLARPDQALVPNRVHRVLDPPRKALDGDALLVGIAAEPVNQVGEYEIDDAVGVAERFRGATDVESVVHGLAGHEDFGYLVGSRDVVMLGIVIMRQYDELKVLCTSSEQFLSAHGGMTGQKELQGSKSTYELVAAMPFPSSQRARGSPEPLLAV